MSGNTHINLSSWRNNWFVKHVLVELPILGSFFSTKSCSEMFYDAGKCAAMFAGGTVTMVLSMPVIAEDDRGKSIKLISSMAAGMMLGKVIYNGTVEGCGMFYQYVSKQKPIKFTPLSPEQSDLVSMHVSKDSSYSNVANAS